MSMRAQKDETLHPDLPTYIPHPLSLSLSYFIPLAITSLFSLPSYSPHDPYLLPFISPLSLAHLPVGKGARRER